MKFEGSAALKADFVGKNELADSFSIESVLRNSNLPQFIKISPIPQLFERLIDANEISRLTELGPNGKDNAERIERHSIRREALNKYLGSTLTCVLVRLPGVLYTIEIDPINCSISHGEWQRAYLLGLRIFPRHL